MGQKGFIKTLLICLAVILVGIATYFLFIHALRAVPEEIEINGTEYTLETYLQRDFGPICPPDGQPLVALVKVKAPGETAISSKIDATRLWLVKGVEIWETELTDLTRPEYSTIGDTLEKIGRDGPKWEPEITVDVVVKIIDLESGESYLLKASNQYIHMTA